MTNPTWELVKIARMRALADRLEAESLARADAAGNHEMNARYAYALGYLAHEAARRIVGLEDARDVPNPPPAQGAAAPNPPTPERGGVPLHVVPRASRR